MGVRANALTNFKGDPYLTRPDLEEIIGGNVEGIIDEETGNLRHDLNPIHITSMERAASGKDDDDKKDQDFNTVKFIGNCKVQYNDDGTITIRIGDNLNSSLYNTTDGISNATVTGAKNGDVSATPSADYSGANGSTAFRVFQTGDTITASTGTTAAVAGGATDGTNGTTTHFDDNANGKFKVYIKKGDTTETYVVGPITANGTYYGKLNGEGNNVTGIACVVTNWGEEAMSAKGATGYMANVNFTLTPASIYSDSTTFQVVKIEMCEGDSAVATWNASSAVNGTYMYIKETTTPGTPDTVDYTLSNVTEKWISGVKYYTTDTKATPSATGITNVGYPATQGNKVVFSTSGGEWTTGENITASNKFDNWTTAKDVSTGTVTGTTQSLKYGEFSNPQITATPHNINGNGTAKTSTKTNNALLVCDANGWINEEHGSITPSINRLYTNPENYNWGYWTEAKEHNSISGWDCYTDVEDLGTTVPHEDDDSESYFGCLGHLQIYNGFIQYPDKNFTSFNGGGNPNYASLTYTGKRYFITTVTKDGVIAGGTLKLTTDVNPASAISQGKLNMYLIHEDYSLYGDCGSWKPVVLNNSGIATAYAWNASTKTYSINFEFKQSYQYGDEGWLYLIIIMTSDCGVKIGGIELA